jgi:hypothetical protein
MEGYFEFAIMGIVQADTEGDAEQQIEGFSGTYDDLQEQFEDVRLSLIRMPTEYARRKHSVRVEEPLRGEYDEVTLAPEAGVVHPWDQGLWIFPEDHPLAPMERQARQGDAYRTLPKEGQDKVKQFFLTQGDTDA